MAKNLLKTNYFPFHTEKYDGEIKICLYENTGFFKAAQYEAQVTITPEEYWGKACYLRPSWSFNKINQYERRCAQCFAQAIHWENDYRDLLSLLPEEINDIISASHEVDAFVDKFDVDGTGYEIVGYVTGLFSPMSRERRNNALQKYGIQNEADTTVEFFITPNSVTMKCRKKEIALNYSEVYIRYFAPFLTQSIDSFYKM